MKLIELDWGLSPFICDHFGLTYDLVLRWTPLLLVWISFIVFESKKKAILTKEVVKVTRNFITVRRVKHYHKIVIKWCLNQNKNKMWLCCSGNNVIKKACYLSLKTSWNKGVEIWKSLPRRIIPLERNNSFISGKPAICPCIPNCVMWNYNLPGCQCVKTLMNS